MEGAAPPSSMDPADKAGGEVIFTSDGLDPLEPPLALVRAPPLLSSNRRDASDGSPVDELDTSSGTDVVQAFEIFAGKVYAPTTTNTSLSTSLSTRSASLETPLERLARLQRELTELQADVAPTAGSDSAVLTAVQDLQARLAQTKLMAQSEWTEILVQAQSPPAPDSAPSASPSATLNDATLLRLQRMEQTVGVSAASTGASLTERLSRLETAASKLDDRQVESLSRKAKVIRQDLEAASKARNKLMSSTGSRAEDTKTITDLYDQLLQLQGLSAHLPALTSRLATLAHQHADTGTWAARLQETESVATRLQSCVLVLEQSLDKMQNGLNENVTKMAENLKSLDARLDALGNK
jgi:hypothetical protein